MIRQLIKSIHRKEWLFVLWTTLFIILITTLPYLYGYYQTPPNHTYTGLHSLTPGDIHVYFSWMEQVKQGNFISHDLYTSEPQSRILLNSFWSVEGLIAKGTGLSNNMVFQLSRIILIPFFVFLLYLISAYFFSSRLWRTITFIFFSFASGLGVLITVFLPNSVYAKGWYDWPLDLWAPESNNLLTMFQSPHLILSTSLLILILFLALFSFEKDSIRYSISAGILALILFQFHPFHTPTVLSILAVYFILQFLLNLKKLKDKKEYLFNIVKHSTLITLISLPSILYWLVLERYDFITQIRTFQNVTLTPSLWVAITSYGLVLILALWAIYKIITAKKLNNHYLFLIVWLLVQFALMYSPLLFQRRLMQGLQIPMIILAVFGLYFIYNYLKTKLSAKNFDFYIHNKWLMIIIFILFFTSSNIYNWIREIAVFAEIYPQLYLANDKIAGYDWLKTNTPQGTVVLTDLYNGNIIPGRTGRKVFVGHGVETLFFESKLNQMLWFFTTNHLDDKKQQFLKDNNIQYIFYSDNEKDIGTFNPNQKDYLQRVFSQDGVDIYQVID